MWSSGLCLLALSSKAVVMLVRQASITPRLPRAIRPRKSYLVWYQKPATMPRTWKGSSRPTSSNVWLKLASNSLRNLTNAELFSWFPARAVMRKLCLRHQASKDSRMAISLAIRPVLPSMAGLRSARRCSSLRKSKYCPSRVTKRSFGLRPWAANSRAFSSTSALGTPPSR
ncbi:hypothetical protein D3C81_1731490 [compost metagenome]